MTETHIIDWLVKVKSKVKVILRPTVSRPVWLGVKSHLGPKTRLSLLWNSCGFVHVGRRIWREDGSVVNSCCWLSSAQSYLQRSKSVVHVIRIYSFTCRHSTVSCQETGSLWSPNIYSFIRNSRIYTCTIYTRLCLVHALTHVAHVTTSS
jgi:hypothetical protein